MYSLSMHASTAHTARPGSMSMFDAAPTVTIVDDDISIREALEPMLTLEGWHVVCFDSATGFLEGGAPKGPGCLLLDVSLPDLSGLDLQVRIAQERPELPIIFLTGYGDVPMTVRAMKAGAAEFLTKPFDHDVLLGAVARAIDRSRELSEQHDHLRSIEARYASLSKREREVMHLVVAGLLNKQVGGELSISEITVKAHRGRLMEKMKAASFADLVKMSERLGLETTSRR
jgi:FixJ family two-component response regulator